VNQHFISINDALNNFFSIALVRTMFSFLAKSHCMHQRRILKSSC